MDLLSLKDFEVEGHCAILDGLFGIPAWIVCAAGCSPCQTIFHRGTPESLNLESKVDCLEEGDVIIVCGR